MSSAPSWWLGAIRITSRCSRCSFSRRTSCLPCGSRRAGCGTSSEAASSSPRAAGAPDDVIVRIGAATVAGFLLVGAATPASPGRFLRNVHAGQTYRLYVPGTGPSESGSAPLVVALHGCWQTPEDFAVGTRLNEAAERRGLVVLYPVLTRAANANRWWYWLERAYRDRGGGAMVVGLIDQVVAGTHVYLGG